MFCRQLLYETCVSHPHHTLYCVLALANANRDAELLQQGRANKRTSRLSKSQPETAVEEVCCLVKKKRK